MTILGLVAAVVLIAATVVLAVSWPTAPQRSSHLPIRFYAYDPANARLSQVSRTVFQKGQIPVATVEGNAVDTGPRKAVRATWYDALGHQTNSVDLPDLGKLRSGPVPLSTTSAVPPGDYQFVLATVEDDRVVEVLAWVHVEIER
ncbi:hypothetical protein ABGB07_07255 [Micromonosporaceae bacterium B7E4]